MYGETSTQKEGYFKYWELGGCASLVNTHKKMEKQRMTLFLWLKRGKKRSQWFCSKAEKKEKKQAERREQPTCYHTVFNNSVAATRGLHVHATAVQCLLGVCATHKRASIQKSRLPALSVSCRRQRGRSSQRPLPLNAWTFTQRSCSALRGRVNFVLALRSFWKGSSWKWTQNTLTALLSPLAALYHLIVQQHYYWRPVFFKFTYSLRT